MKRAISISERQQRQVSGHEQVVRALNVLLADEFLLYQKTRNYHWNVTGPQFVQLHEFFEKQYKELEKIIDDVAERARALGGNAIGTVKELAEHARLKESPGEYPDAQTMIRTLFEDHQAIVRHIRADLKNAPVDEHRITNDFLALLMEKHEKMAWMLGSCLEA
jgi:starvation-inducible DNA-binding protein